MEEANVESPRIHEDAEERSSSESGWTMYIEDNHHSRVVYDDDDDDDDDVGDDGSEDESNDSMTSDASSWPSTQLPKKTKNHENDNDNVKQVNHQTKKRVCETFSDDDDEEESEFMARTRTTTANCVQSGDNVSKTK